jgi:hypothetical protein
MRPVVAPIDNPPPHSGGGCTLCKQTPRPAAVASPMGHNRPPAPLEAQEIDDVRQYPVADRPAARAASTGMRRDGQMQHTTAEVRPDAECRTNPLHFREGSISDSSLNPVRAKRTLQKRHRTYNNYN